MVALVCKRFVHKLFRLRLIKDVTHELLCDVPDLVVVLSHQVGDVAKLVASLLKK